MKLPKQIVNLKETIVIPFKSSNSHIKGQNYFLTIEKFLL